MPKSPFQLFSCVPCVPYPPCFLGSQSKFFYHIQTKKKTKHEY
jgi:hypothetical protein